jgi:hypothetical protein
MGARQMNQRVEGAVQRDVQHVTEVVLIHAAVGR